MELRITGRRRYQRIWWRLLGWSFPTLDASEDPHPAVELDGIPELAEIPIDREIAAIVQSLWARGVPTANSCQGDAELERLSGHRELYSATVSFDGREAAETFAQLIEESRPRPYELGDLDRVLLTRVSTPPAQDSVYHVRFPPSLIPGLRALLAPRSE